MPISSTEFDVIATSVKEKKLKTANDVLAHILKHFVGDEMSRSFSNTKSGIKNGAKAIQKNGGEIDTAVRKREREVGFKVRTEAEAQLGDEARVARGRGKTNQGK